MGSSLGATAGALVLRSCLPCLVSSAHPSLYRDVSAKLGNGMLTALGLVSGPQWG